MHLINFVQKNLKGLQEWFGAIITQPLKKNQSLKDAKSALYITPTIQLTPDKRIEIYQEQYWWRLIKVMQENFPGLNSLFGKAEFNQKIAIPYLKRHPSTHFLLNHLGDKLLAWLEVDYQDSNKKLVQNIATIDWLTNVTFFAPSQKVGSEINERMKLALQPHVHLFSLEADYFSFREELLKKRIKNTLLKEPCYFILYRNLENDVAWKKISYPAYLLLTYIKEGNSLTSACEKLEEWGNLSKTDEEEIPVWIYEWLTKGFITQYC